MLFTAPKSLLKGESSERNIQGATLSLAKLSAAKETPLEVGSLWV